MNDQPEAPPVEAKAPVSNRRRWLVPLALIVIAGGGYAYWQMRGDAAQTSSNNVQLKTTTTGSAVEPERIVRGSVTDLLNDHPIEEAENPLDPLLMVAERGLEKLRNNLKDYTATIERQERVNGQLMPTETIALKIRQSQKDDQGNVVVPRGIYTRHVAPTDLAGQEAIWVEGENGGKLVAHTTGMLNLKRFYLPPTGFLAMRGSRYPMTEAGFEVLIQRMLERGKRDRDYGTCTVRVSRDATINGRTCTAFEIVHETEEGPYDFHIAKIAIDDELDLPIHYEAHIWPEEEGGEPRLLERYTYTDIEINPGLTEEDFDPSNPDYDYPAR